MVSQAELARKVAAGLNTRSGARLGPTFLVRFYCDNTDTWLTDAQRASVARKAKKLQFAQLKKEFEPGAKDFIASLR